MTHNFEIAKKRMQKLIRILSNASHQYYQHGDSELSDTQYDKLENELKVLENKFSMLKLQSSPTSKINDGINTNFANIAHQTAMLSLKNIYTKEELVQWHQTLLKKTKQQLDFYCDFKVDGMAISLFYKKGIFFQSITRGDGQVGEDLTRNIKQIVSLPKQVSYKKDFELRGEIFFPKESFERFNKQKQINGEAPYKNPRNATVGTVRMKDTDISNRGLKIFIYDILSGAFSTTHHLNLIELKKLGFLIFPEYCLSNDLDKIWNYQQMIMAKREKFSFQIDGIVCRVNDSSLRQVLGADSKSPKWAIALKFQSQQVQTKLKYIENFVGRSGVITPVAWLEPVELLSTRVQKASLYNYAQIQKLDIRNNDTLIIEKGGDIIPKVVAVNLTQRSSDKPFLPPTDCPQCHQALTISDTKIDLYCTNQLCPAIILGNLEHYVSKKGMDIKTLGPSRLKKFFEAGWLTQISEIYTLYIKKDLVSALEGFGEKSLTELFLNIEQSKNNKLDKLIYAIGIPHIGENFSKQLASASKNIDGLIVIERSVLEKLENFGDIVIDSVLNWLKQNKNLLLDLKTNGVAFKNYEEKNAKLGSIAITGELSLSRNRWKEILETKGFKVTSQINKKTTILLAESSTKNSSKIAKAKEWGIRVLEETEFRQEFKI